ncbi:MAG: hypothetical protein AAB805_01480 [Patescibacteria group bacterium]
MSTIKKRINITLSSDLEKGLKFLARRDRVPEATKAAEMLQFAFELEEDRALTEIAAKRDVKGAKYIPYKQAWKEFTK